MSGELEFSYSSKIAHGIWKVVPPIFLVVGLLGNILSIAVLTRKNIRKSTTSVYLTVLAISDLSLLYFGLLPDCLRFGFQFHLDEVNEFACKFVYFSTYMFSDLSAWILVAVTFERVVLVWQPHTGKTFCSRVNAAIIIAVIITALVLINGHLLYGFGHQVEKDENLTVVIKCSVTNEKHYEYFFFTVFPWVDITVLSIGPSLLLFIGNSLIIGRIYYNRKKLQSQVVPLTTQQQSTQKKTSSLTIMAIALSAAFLFSSTPILVYHICINALIDIETTYQNLPLSVCLLLMYANNTFNFVLYVLNGQKFRKEMMSLFCCKNMSTVVPN